MRVVSGWRVAEVVADLLQRQTFSQQVSRTGMAKGVRPKSSQGRTDDAQPSRDDQIERSIGAMGEAGRDNVRGRPHAEACVAAPP